MVLIHFFVFLALDLVLVALAAVGGFVFAEWTASDIANQLKNAPPGGILAESISERRALTLGDVDVSYEKTVPKGLPISGIRNIFPENTRAAEREFRYDANADKFSGQLLSVSYAVSIPDEAKPAGNSTAPGGYTVIVLHVGRYLATAKIAFHVILVFQLLSLIHTGFKSGRAIDRTLKPLRELLAATQAFAEASKSSSGKYSTEALKNLARALDSVGAGHLDRRIPSEVITEELRPLALAINDMLVRIDEGYNSQIRFVSDASHELRTPIAVIQGYANMLSRWGSEDPETLRESIEAIKSEAAAMKQMVNQLLFLARGDSASMKLDWGTLNLSRIASEVIKEETMIDQAHVFRSHIEDGVFIEGDSGLIKQLLRILTDNSVKYTEPGGAITVKLTQTPPMPGFGGDAFPRGHAILTVQDEGVGIPADILPHIFDRFVRADESRTRDTGGAGLGLSIAQWVAERHGGHMEVLSRENAGSRFTVILPLAARGSAPITP
jgi:signal transduction histidine kinase